MREILFLSCVYGRPHYYNNANGINYGKYQLWKFSAKTFFIPHYNCSNCRHYSVIARIVSDGYFVAIFFNLTFYWMESQSSFSSAVKASCFPSAVSIDSKNFSVLLRSVYKELHADRETGC